MRIDDVRLGSKYSHHSLPEPLTAIGWGRNGYGVPTVELHDQAGNYIEAEARYLTPWDQFLSEQQALEEEAREMERLAERLTGGEGRSQAEHYYKKTFHLRFDEHSAQALLVRMGFKGLSSECRPSGAQSERERRDCRLRLARRVRRALKVGTASTFELDLLDDPGLDCQLEVTSMELGQAVERILGRPDCLAELLA